MCKQCGCENPWRGIGSGPRKKIIPMPSDEAAIIAGAVENSLCWGTGMLTTCKEALEDEGYEWTGRHEAYVFENYIDEY